jgi:hypothetical protein
MRGIRASADGRDYGLAVVEAAALTVSIIAILIAGASALVTYRIYRIERDRRADEQREHAPEVVPSFEGTMFVLTNRGGSSAFKVEFNEEGEGAKVIPAPDDLPLDALHAGQAAPFIVGPKMLGEPRTIPVVVSWEDASGRSFQVRHELSR